MLCTGLTFGGLRAQVRLPVLVRDSMVLQRDVPLPLWGWAAPGETVRVRFRGKSYKTNTASNGHWRLKLAPQTAGGPFTMHIEGKNRVALKEVLVGDVWLCAGQSNMEHSLQLHDSRYAADIAAAHYPQIRQFRVPQAAALTGPQAQGGGGSWIAADPATVRRFTAVGYFMARALHERYRVPIGIINASWGGTPIEAWMSEEALTAFPPAFAQLQKNKDTGRIYTMIRTADAYTPPPVHDAGTAGPLPWFDTAYRPVGWRPATVPGYWEDGGVRQFDGIMWYRKEFTVPSSMAGKPARLLLGRIVDADEAYLNGALVGRTYYQYPQRRYPVPAGLLQAGRNVLVLRIQNWGGKGGFVPDKPYGIFGDTDSVSLKGDWLYRVGAPFVPDPKRPPSFSPQNAPAALFNGMLAPLLPYALKGAAWYQGESNVMSAPEYGSLLQGLIRDWRRHWEAPLPFLLVQLPGYDDVQYLPSESPWAELREGQRSALAEPRTGMAVAIDLGEWNDIHPGRKKEVGERLALAAQRVAYNDTALVGWGPLFAGQQVEGGRIRLRFSSVGSGLVTRDGGPPQGFAIAGADKRFVWAAARIEGNEVVLWNDAVAEPRYVRYAWADNPDNPNLYNREGLPASPFRTDQ